MVVVAVVQTWCDHAPDAHENRLLSEAACRSPLEVGREFRHRHVVDNTHYRNAFDAAGHVEVALDDNSHGSDMVRLMNVFSLDDLARVRAEHVSNGLGSYDEVLREVSLRAKNAGELGKLDVGALVLWKRMRADTKWARTLNLMADSEVRRVTGEALAVYRACVSAGEQVAAAANTARRALVDLPGCGHGTALASVVLTTVDLENLAVYDRWAVRALSGNPRSRDMLGRDDHGRYGRYIEQVTELRVELAAHTSDTWTGRDVDLALYRVGRASA